MVAQVVPESPAEKAKLQVDDVITEVNGKTVDSREALVSTVRTYLPGQEIKLLVKEFGTDRTARDGHARAARRATPQPEQ